MTRFLRQPLRPAEPIGLPATDLEPWRRAPRRLSVTLSWQTLQALLQRADVEGRSASNLAAFLLETALSKPSQS